MLKDITFKQLLNFFEKNDLDDEDYDEVYYYIKTKFNLFRYFRFVDERITIKQIGLREDDRVSLYDEEEFIIEVNDIKVFNINSKISEYPDLHLYLEIKEDMDDEKILRYLVTEKLNANWRICLDVLWRRNRQY